MERKYYFRGLGLGIVVTAIIMGAATSRSRAMTDREIIARAKELGMVENTVLADMDVKQAEEFDRSGAEDESGVQDDNGSAAGKDQAAEDETKAGDQAFADGSKAEEINQGQADGNEAGKTDQSQDGSIEAGKTDQSQDGSIEAGKTDQGQDGNSKAGKTDRNQIDSSEVKENNEGSGVDSDTEENRVAGSNGKADKEETAQGNGKSPTEDSKAEAGLINEQDEGDGKQDRPLTGNESKKPAGSASITVSRGDGSHTVAKKLADAGVVSSADNFDQFLCENGYDKKLRTGTFRIPAGADDEQIAKIITGVE